MRAPQQQGCRSYFRQEFLRWRRGYENTLYPWSPYFRRYLFYETGWILTYETFLETFTWERRGKRRKHNFLKELVKLGIGERGQSLHRRACIGQICDQMHANQSDLLNKLIVHDSKHLSD
jgi:hypothetical protein